MWRGITEFRKVGIHCNGGILGLLIAFFSNWYSFVNKRKFWWGAGLIGGVWSFPWKITYVEVYLLYCELNLWILGEKIGWLGSLSLMHSYFPPFPLKPTKDSSGHAKFPSDIWLKSYIFRSLWQPKRWKAPLELFVLSKWMLQYFTRMILLFGPKKGLWEG